MVMMACWVAMAQVEATNAAARIRGWRSMSICLLLDDLVLLEVKCVLCKIAEATECTVSSRSNAVTMICARMKRQVPSAVCLHGAFLLGHVVT